MGNARLEFLLLLDEIEKCFCSIAIKVDGELVRWQDLEGRVLPLYLVSLIFAFAELLPKKQNEFHLVDVLSCDIDGGFLWAVHDLSIFHKSIALG